jgi:hypothetical protein
VLVLRGELGVVVPVEGSQDQLVLIWWSLAYRPTSMMIED